MKKDYDETIYHTLTELRNEINTLKVEYNKPVKEKLVVPNHIQSWLHNWMFGINFGKKPYIKWISPDEKYVIITTPGGTAGTGTIMGASAYYYASTTQYLVKIIENAGWHDRLHSQIAECEGRLTKEKFNEWMKLIEENKRK